MNPAHVHMHTHTPTHTHTHKHQRQNYHECAGLCIDMVIHSPSTNTHNVNVQYYYHYFITYYVYTVDQQLNNDTRSEETVKSYHTTATRSNSSTKS